MSTFRRIAMAVGGVGGMALLFHVGSSDSVVSRVKASWTTDYTPSVAWDSNWDKCSPESLLRPSKKEIASGDEQADKLKEKVATASRHLIFIRHGQYCEDADSDDKRILTPLGREQAELSGLRLKALGYPYTKLIRSSMARALETSEIISSHLPLVPKQTSDLLREGAPIPPEPPVGHWRPGVNFYIDGARIEAAFRYYVHRAPPTQEKDSYEIIVCHANVIRYFVCRALQFPPEAWLRLGLHHGSITWLTIRPNGRVSLLTLGDSGFLPPSKMTLVSNRTL